MLFINRGCVSEDTCNKNDALVLATSSFFVCARHGTYSVNYPSTRFPFLRHLPLCCLDVCSDRFPPSSLWSSFLTFAHFYMTLNFTADTLFLYTITFSQTEILW